MEYNFSNDLMSIREILNLSQEDLAYELSVEQVTISKNESGEVRPSAKMLEDVYSFAFKEKIRINKIKEMLARDDLKKNEKLLFHGSKSGIQGCLNIKKGRKNNDFGQGFYVGENYEQAVSFISNFEDSSVYYMSFVDENLTCKKYEVDQDWMMTIAYYRGALDEYSNHHIIQKLIKESKNCDYIIAPIADNRMFQIINSFINGEITDEQCKHCLAATNLGMQYIFKSERSIAQLKLIERCYISKEERKYYKTKRQEESKLGEDKVKLARKQYRGKGRYIDEILGGLV